MEMKRNLDKMTLVCNKLEVAMFEQGQEIDKNG